MSPTSATRRPAAPRGDGQWALGHREPLNDTERFKRDNDGLDVRDRILNTYARHGFASIDPSDLRGRFRWYGLYTQRRPGIDGGRTAGLEPHQLEDEYFMLRVRIPGGQLSTRQLSVIGDLATRYGRDVADITNRQNIQLHWVRIEDVPAIWERFDAVGLSTTEACGDTPRNMLGCPLAGIAESAVRAPTPSPRPRPANTARGTVGARTATPWRPAVLDGEQPLLGEPVEVHSADPPTDPEGLRRLLAADRPARTGDQVEHGPAGRIVQGGDAGGPRD